jgi:hypothetical protein
MIHLLRDKANPAQIQAMLEEYGAMLRVKYWERRDD